MTNLESYSSIEKWEAFQLQLDQTGIRCLQTDEMEESEFRGSS